MFWSPFKQKILVAANICCKTIAWVAVMFLPAPQESLKGAIIFGTPMVLAGQSSLPSCGTRSQPGAVRAGVRCSAPCDPGVSEENFSCLLKWPKRKPPSVTHRAPFSNRWSGQALLGFPEAAPAPPLPPGEPRRGKPRADAVAPGCPRAVPRSLLSGLIRLGPSRPRWVAAAPAGPAALCGRGGEGAQAAGPGRGAIHQQDGYCWEEFLPGGMNLRWLFSGAGDVPLPCGQGHGWARGWTLPHPLTPSSTPTHAPRRELGLRGAQRPPNPPLLHSGFTGTPGLGDGWAQPHCIVSVLSHAAPSWRIVCWTLARVLSHAGGCSHLLAISSWSPGLDSLDPTRVSPLQDPHCHSQIIPGCTNQRKIVESLWDFVSDGDVPSVLEEWVVAFAWWLWVPGWGIVLSSWSRVTKGAEGVSSYFWIVWSDYVVLGETIRKQKHKDSSWTFVLFCIFFLFYFFSKEAFSVLACWVLRE